MSWLCREFLRSAWMLVLLYVPETLAAAPPGPDSISGLSIAGLEKEIELTRQKLEQLPLRLIRESGGTLGIRSFNSSNKPAEAWVEVDLQETRKFDTIVVVPAVNIAKDQSSSNFAFPLLFQIRAYASAEDETGQLLFDSSLNPLIPVPSESPVIIDCPGKAGKPL